MRDDGWATAPIPAGPSCCARSRGGAGETLAAGVGDGHPLAANSTLNRMELGAGTKDRYKKITFWKEALDELLVKIFIESHDKAPADSQ